MKKTRPPPANALVLCKRLTLLLDSGVLADEQFNERTQQRFASLAHVVNELEEPEVEREFFL